MPASKSNEIVTHDRPLRDYLCSRVPTITFARAPGTFTSVSQRLLPHACHSLTGYRQHGGYSKERRTGPVGPIEPEPLPRGIEGGQTDRFTEV